MLTSEQLVKRMEAEERVENRFSWFYFAITFLLSMFFILMFALHPVTAHAMVRSFEYNESNYSLTVPDSLLEQYPYYYIVYDSYQTGTYSVYLTDKKVYSASEKGHFVSNEKNIAWRLYQVGNRSTREFVIESDKYSNKGVWSNDPLYVFENGSGSCLFSVYTSFIYSNANIQYAEYDKVTARYTVKSDSFFIPPAEVQAKVAVELPAVVVANLKMIVPVAVFCLASLIGCLVLAKKYRIFLH